MGIDIYAQWVGQSEAEQQAQVTGFDVTKGCVGYLREAYHGAPYATGYLLQEAFDSSDGRAKIPAARLRERLPETIAIALERERTVYQNAQVSERDPVIRSYVEFVELCERKEQETGEPVTIVASY